MTDKKKLLEGDPLTILKPFLGNWDLPDEGDLILTIGEIYEQEVRNATGAENKPVMYFKEDVKPLILNKTNRDTIAKLYGRRTKSNTWAGKKIALYAAREPRSKDGLAVRIRDYQPKTPEIYCEACGEIVTDVEIDGKTFKAKAIANNALTKFGKYLCYSCAQEAKKEAESK